MEDMLLKSSKAFQTARVIISATLLGDYGLFPSTTRLFSFIRTLLELIVGSGLAALLIFRGLPIVANKEDIICDLHGFLYECAGHPQELYFILLYIVIVITIGFIAW